MQRGYGNVMSAENFSLFSKYIIKDYRLVMIQERIMRQQDVLGQHGYIRSVCPPPLPPSPPPPRKRTLVLE